MGEKDFKNDYDNIELIRNIRDKVQEISHTNVIICLPTYICGAPIFNYAVETFGKLLIEDMLKDHYWYVFDTNKELSLEMFSNYTGKMNKYGVRNVFQNLEKYINGLLTFFRE